MCFKILKCYPFCSYFSTSYKSCIRRVLLDWIAGLLNPDCNPIWWIELWLTIQRKNWILDLDFQSKSNTSNYFIMILKFQSELCSNNKAKLLFSKFHNWLISKVLIDKRCLLGIQWLHHKTWPFNICCPWIWKISKKDN